MASSAWRAARTGTGLFPREVMRHFPLLPLEEEGHLNDNPYPKELMLRNHA